MSEKENNTPEAAALATARKEEVELKSKLLRLELANKKESQAIKDAGDFRSGYFSLTSKVDGSSIDYLLGQLRRYSRLYPGKPITIELFSPGGSIIDGFRLYDELASFRSGGGHHLTIKVRGQAASMAVPILQAADERIVGASAFVMIHRASYGAGGEAYKVEDQAEFVKLLEARIVDILAERSGQPATYFTDLLSQRKDIWYTGAQAVEHLLADRLG